MKVYPKVYAQVQLILGSKLTIRKLLRYGISGNKVAGEVISGHTLQIIYKTHSIT